MIPVYQRNYAWNEEQCKQLLEDIIEVGSSSIDAAKVHFIGSIVYIRNDEYMITDVDQCVIIDGQQRITTITLLLIALYHFAEKQGDSKLAETIYEQYLINKHADDLYKVKLKVTENNERDLHCLLGKDPIPDSAYSKIINNYNFFSKSINESNRGIIYEGFKRLSFVEIGLERGRDNAQKIFESLNSTGVVLSQADLIRNYILMGLDLPEQERLYNRYWSEIESNTKDEGVSHVSDFIRDYLTIRRGNIPNKDKVYDTFKKEFRLDKSDELENMLSDLKKFSGIYKCFLNPECIEDKDIKSEISYIKYIEINVSYPFLLQVLDDYNSGTITKDILLKVLRFVQTYACRRFILDLPTNALNKIFMNLYKQIDKTNYEQSLYHYVLKRDGRRRMPSDIEIKNHLPDKDLYKSPKMRLYILERLENFKNKEKVEIIRSPNITIEHIFPQKPDSRWKKELSEDDYKFFLEKIHTIGNLTLSGNNETLGNRTFQEKKNMNKGNGEQGYLYSRLWLNRSLNDIDKWDISNYKKRTESLITRFLQIWPMPQIAETEGLPEINISSIDPNVATNKSIEYAIFFGEKFPGDKFKGIKLYNYILKQLLVLYTEEEIIHKIGNILRLTENPNKLNRRYAPLNSTYYYDTNLSYYQIFLNLKRILEELGLSNELSIKFREKE